MWPSPQCGHFGEAMNFEHRFRESTFPLPIFVPWHCVEAYPIISQNRRRFHGLVDCSERCRLETHRVMHVPTPPEFSYYVDWLFAGSFRHLIFTVVRSKFATNTAVQVLLVATKGVFGSFCIDDRVRLRWPFLVALRLSVISHIDFMDIKKWSMTMRMIWRP